MKNSMLITLTFLFVTIFLQAQNLEWLSPISEDIDDYDVQSYNLSVTVDKKGDVYSAGVIKGTNDSADGRFFVEKRNSNGQILWKQIYDLGEGNGVFDEIVYSISIANFQRIQIGGEANHKSKLLLIKQGDGQLINQREITGDPNKIIAIKPVLNESGNFLAGYTYVTGYFRGSIVLKGSGQTNITLVSGGGTDAFIGRWNGHYFTTAVKISGMNDQIPFDIEIDKDENIYLSYLTKGNVQLNEQSITSFSSNNFRGYLLKINKNYNLIYNQDIVIGNSQIGLQQPSHLSQGNISGGDEIIKFPITLNGNILYFSYNRKYTSNNNSQSRLLGKVDALNGETLLTKFIDLNNNAEPTDNPNLDVHDILASSCDSLYLILKSTDISGGPLISDFRNLGEAGYLLTYATNNLTKTSKIGNLEGQLNLSNLCMDSNKNIYFCGFFNNYPSTFLFANDPDDYPDYTNYEQLDYSNDKSFVAKYQPCQNIVTQVGMISGPSSVCPDNYPVSWTIANPVNTSGCQLIIESTNPNHPNPTTTINYTLPTSNNPNFTINNLNGYQYPIKIYYKCIQNCCESIYDEKILTPLLAFQPIIGHLKVIESNGIISVGAYSTDLNIPNIVFLWQLYEGEVVDNGTGAINIIIKGEATSEEILLHQEFDDVNNNNEIQYVYSGLENKPYVIKLGVYYQYPNSGSCGWYETRKGFLVDSNGNYRISGEKRMYRVNKVLNNKQN